MAGTYSKGLEGVIAAETKISFIDGEKGVLEFVGIPIGELASNSTFEDGVPAVERSPAQGGGAGRFPEEHPAATSCPVHPRFDPVDAQDYAADARHADRDQRMGLVDPKPNLTDLPSVRDKAMTSGDGADDAGPVPAPLHRPERDHARSNRSIAENALYMISGKKPTPTMAKALDVCLVLHTDHGLNSTFSCVWAISRSATCTRPSLRRWVRSRPASRRAR